MSRQSQAADLTNKVLVALFQPESKDVIRYHGLSIVTNKGVAEKGRNGMARGYWIAHVKVTEPER